MKITEIYFRNHETKKGQQWIELFNTTDQAVNLRRANIRKIDGKKNPKQVWKLELPNEDLRIEPGQYVLLAQQADLGQKLCTDKHKIIVLKDKNFGFDSQGVQTLCVKAQEEAEFCRQISDSKKTEKNTSRNLADHSWETEECALKSNLFASPGLPAGFCQDSQTSGWFECPEQPIESLPHHDMSCQSVTGVLDAWVALFLILCLGRYLCKPTH